MLLIAISALPLLLMLVYRYPTAVLWSFPVVWLFAVFLPYFPIRAGGIVLIPTDAVYFLAALYLGIWFLRHPQRAIAVLKENPFLTLFLAMVAIYVVLYTPVYGKSAIGEARKFYGFFLFPLFALVLLKKPEDFHRFLQVIVATAAVVALGAIIRTGAEGTFLRVINAPGTLIMTLAAFALIVHRMNRVVLFHPRADKILLVLLAALVVGSGQRSAWLAVGAGSVFLLWLEYGRPVLIAKIAVVAFAVVMTLGTALVYFPEVGGKLAEKFAGIVNPLEDPNASWRIEGWQQQLAYIHERGPLFGEGIGNYYRWDEIEERTNPHNAYVQTILKFGLFGLTMYGLLVAHFFRRALAVRKKMGPGPMRAWVETGMLNFAAAHGFFLGYPFELNSIMYFALAVCAIRLYRESVGHSPLRQGRPFRSNFDIVPQPYRLPRPPETARS